MTNNRPSDEANGGREKGETLLPDVLRCELPPLYSIEPVRLGDLTADSSAREG